MKIIRPITITDDMMTSSDVLETDYAEWDSTTTYNAGEKVMVLIHGKTDSVGSNYLASHRGNFIVGNAFFEVNGVDLSDFVGTDEGSTPYWIELEDSAGKKATGYIAGGGLGRVLSNNLILDGTFDKKDHDGSNPWTWGAGWTDSNRRAISANGALLSQDAGLVINQLYYAGIQVYAFTSGKVALFYGSSGNDFYERVSAATFTEYAMTDGDPDFGANGFGASALTIDNLSVKEVLEPVAASSGGLHIVSTYNETYREWENIEAGFNPAEIATYAIVQIGFAYHKCYEALLGTNLNKFPPNNLIGTSPYWLELESTNRWKVFDAKTGSQTSNTTTITYVLVPGAFDAIAFFNLDATTINIDITDPVYSGTITLSGATEAVKLDISGSATATLTITINKTGTPLCGEIVLGLQYAMGTTLYDPDLGITDYSIKDTDDFGNYVFLERAFSARNSFDLLFANTVIDAAFEMIAAYRATPLVWADEKDAALLTYGFYKNFDMQIISPNWSTVTVEIDGLT